VHWLETRRAIGGFLLVLAVGAGPAEAASPSRRTAVVDAVKKVQPSVVSISSEKRSSSTSRWPFTQEENQRPRVNGMGTGVVIDERGYILTNQHVVDRVQGIEVVLSDGARHPARVVQQDPAMDIALLKVDAGKPLPAVRMGLSADLMVGEDVITIGNAFGYENTVSVGIVSALGRNVTLSDDQVYRNLIQTDACINPGNSGGPLVNIDGELIGINVAVRAGAQGIGFALPIDDVKRVAVEMISTRRLASTWHGIVASESVQPTGRTVVVAGVQPGSPAESAGVKPGDQLVKAGALALSTPIDLERALLDLRPGQATEIVVNRGGQPQAIKLEVQAAPQAGLATTTAPTGEDPIWRNLGMRVVPVSREYVAAVSADFRGGLFVQNVQPGGPAERSSIQKGDILVGMNVGNRDWETIRTDNILYILNLPEVNQTGTIQYYVVRRNGFLQGSLVLGGTQTASARR
jgi:serine protease Do